jgi:AmmeMemoRadiSam system protein B
MTVRQPAVAGLFYPSEPGALRATVAAAMAAAGSPGAGPVPRAVIAPHAGYRYSGPVAASAYVRLGAGRGTIRRVVIVGPAHRYPLSGVAASTAGAFATPLGTVPVDRAARDGALELPGDAVCDAAYAGEHSLEVHLPFLQVALGEIEVLPLLAGRDGDRVVALVISRLWGGADTAVVVSTDLSHYHDYATAVALDRATADAIVRRDADGIDDLQACGAGAVRGLLGADGCDRLGVEELDLRNSGDTAGSRDRVVGYGAFALG